MAVAWDSDSAVDKGADERPDESWNGLRVVCHELQTECQAVDIGAVVCNDTERENDEAELTEAAERGKEHSCEKATDAGLVIAICVVLVVYCGGCDGETEHLGESQWYDKSAPCPGKCLNAADVNRLVDCVVGRIACPARGEAEDAGSKR